jgi:hypothetical protein
MKSRRILTASLITACLAAGSMLATVGCSSNDAYKLAQKANDYQAIVNTMSLHFWYHATNMNDVEMEKAWSKRADCVWAQNGGFVKGRDAIQNYYGKHVDPASAKGSSAWHPQLSPVIEIAGDRQTAKGIWYTIGVVGAYPNGNWMLERYGVDFVNEDGQWKIWHMHVYTDTAFPAGSGAKQGGPGGPGGAPQKAEKVGKESASGGAAPGMPAGMPANPFNPKQDTYKEWGADTIPRLVPRPPEPYKTFSETFSYVDENEWANANR